MKEDTELKNRIGKENPFKVPEGYFENIVPEIMKQLPEAEVQEEVEVTMWERVKPWVYMVAMFCGLMFGLRVMMNDRPVSTGINAGDVSMTDSVQGIPDEYIDPILDQAMMDDYTLYMYLTDADLDIYN
ncbi:Uncharacterised protein [uncultured Bacteroides sp.]|uniref:hypothetical protein n=1 Tax=Bacteroides cellulolyticus TaxID=2981780 RepID=UPI00082146C9|nr:hypothetical protein [Bacteroides cellulolyticus]MCU6772333.1 hypothetical protein [Bacteroides cellulolyticus]SCI32599.1 Uncharacterised protein [uncultured Bacteroides sp.]